MNNNKRKHSWFGILLGAFGIGLVPAAGVALILTPIIHLIVTLSGGYIPINDEGRSDLGLTVFVFSYLIIAAIIARYFYLEKEERRSS